MTIFNTRSPKQRIGDQDYRGSYTQHLTLKQFEAIMSMANRVSAELEDVWAAWFTEPYEVGNWRSISINAASEILENLHEIFAKQLNEQAFMRKVLRNEQQQHDYEMGWEI
jgi:hypothetical protein